MRKLRLQILAAGLAFIGLVTVLLGHNAWKTHEDDHAKAIADLSGQTLALKTYTEASLDNVDGQLQVIAARAAARDSHGLAFGDIGVVLTAQRFNPSYLVNMVVSDAAGAVLHAARPDAPGTLADRDDFAHHRDNADPGLRFGKAIESPAFPGLWRFAMSRRLETRDGKFAGIVVAFLDVALLAREYERMRAHDQSSFILIGEGGHVVARAPLIAEAIGRIVPAAARHFHQPLAIISDTSPIDGQVRLIAQRRLDNYPFVVSATTVESTVHTGWRRDLPTMAAIWLLVALGTFMGGHALVRQVEHATEAHETLRGTSRELEFYKYALDHHAIVGITDVKGHIVYANDKFCEISKYSRDELLGQDHRILNSGHHPKEFFRDMWRAIAQGQPWRGEILNRAKDGSSYWVDTTIVPLLDEQGKPFRYFAMRVEITDRKKAEHELVLAKIAAESARAIAEAANRAKSELIANTSHELRTPLNAIIGFSEMMKMETFGSLAEKYKTYAKDINKSGKHLLALVNDILDVSAIEAGEITLHEEPISLAEALRGAIRLVHPRAEAAGIALKDDIPLGLPKLRADPRRVKQIALNLVVNAVKFSAQGGMVTVTANQGLDGHLFFRVGDTGIGMDKDGIARAMSKFGQVDSSLARKYEGIGLGLPLAHELVALHDGTLNIESEKGRGTTVTVSFPKSRTVVEEAASVS